MRRSRTLRQPNSAAVIQRFKSLGTRRVGSHRNPTLRVRDLITKVPWAFHSISVACIPPPAASASGHSTLHEYVRYPCMIAHGFLRNLVEVGFPWQICWPRMPAANVFPALLLRTFPRPCQYHRLPRCRSSLGSPLYARPVRRK